MNFKKLISKGKGAEIAIFLHSSIKKLKKDNKELKLSFWILFGFTGLMSAVFLAAIMVLSKHVKYLSYQLDKLADKHNILVELTAQATQHPIP